LKSASVLKSTAICQPMATCHQSSNSLLEIAGSPERSRRAGVRLCGLKWRSGGRIDWEAEAKKVHREPRHHDEWDPPIAPYDPYGPGTGVSADDDFVSADDAN
jgi:hypothetical protein